MISSVEDAQKILSSDANFMIRMDIDFSCWIVLGSKNADGIMVASKKKIEEISIDVFKALAKTMGQRYCSEYFQKVTASSPAG